MSSVLKVTQLTKTIGQRTIVDGISFEVNKGEIFGLLGPNGAGKTTTIRMLVGLAKPSSGSVELCGHDIQHDRRNAMKHIGTIVENPELYPYLSGYENLVQFALLSGITDDAVIRNTVHLVGLEDRIHDKVRRYSLGMRQRLGLAQALLHNPSLLILDEPTNGLDPSGIREFRELLVRLSKNGTSILISSHLLLELEMMCSRVGVLHKGKWITTATLEEIHNLSANNRLIIEVDSADEALAFLRAEHQELDIRIERENRIAINYREDALNPILATLIANGVSIRNVERKQQSLEDVFLTMTEGQEHA